MEELRCDVVVIGAGPAGSTAARVAAEQGAKVLLVERKAQAGVPVQCAGYVAKAIRWHVSLPEECIVQSVAGLRTFLPNGVVQEITAPGYMLDRAALDSHLAREAVKSGVRLLLRAPAVARGADGVVIQRGAERLSVEAKVVVGADGPRSLVAQWQGLARHRLARALQYEVALRDPLAVAEVYFRPAWRGGYAWLFPSGGRARVGAAFVGDGREGARELRGFLREMEDKGRIHGPALSATSGFVPVGGPIRLRHGNVLLAGDAAGHTHPITGAGVVNAIIAGEMAGRAAGRAAIRGSLALLGEYEEEWRYVFGSAMEKAVQKRARMEDRWASSPEELSQIVRESWITFDEYASH